MADTFCGKCNNICFGEVLEAKGEFFHQDCFKCKACLKDLLTNGFYNYENEFYCSRDYQKLFGVKCTACGQFIEGGVVTIFDDSFHEACFICVQCSKPFPAGEKVNLSGDDYLCDDCVQPVNDKNANVSAEGLCAGCGNEIKSGQALLALDSQWHLWCFTCNKCGCLLSGEYMGRDGIPYCEKDYQSEFGVTCAGCGGFITGKVLQAGEKHYHPQCSRCAKCGQMFGEGEEMYLQGSEIWHPECSDEYQRELEAEENERLAYQQAERDRTKQRLEEEERVKKEWEERERAERERAERDIAERERAERDIAERERAERERAEREMAEREIAERERAERERAERERTERERAERERAERERAERERAERERAERERAERERTERDIAERERAEREMAEREIAERERAERERAEREREKAERERAERERAEREERLRVEKEKEEQARQRRPPPERFSPREQQTFQGPSPSAFSAKPFGTQKTTPSSISVNFKPSAGVSSAGKWKPPERKPFEPSKTGASYKTGSYIRAAEPTKDVTPTNSQTSRVTTTTEIRTYSIKREGNRSVSPPSSKEDGPRTTAVVTNGYNKASSVSSDEGGPARPPPPPTRGSSQNWKSRMSNASYSADRTTTSPPPRQESPREKEFAPVDVDIDVRSANRPLSYIESASKRDDADQYTKKSSITITSVSKTTDDAPVPNAIFRRLPNRDRDALRENRKSLPAMTNYMFENEQEKGFGSRTEANAHHRRSLPSLEKDAGKSIRAAMTYPYDILRSDNYKMPKDIDKSRLETYLSDEDFGNIFKVDREEFYKQPIWKQRDLKKIMKLF